MATELARIINTESGKSEADDREAISEAGGEYQGTGQYLHSYKFIRN